MVSTRTTFPVGTALEVKQKIRQTDLVKEVLTIAEVAKRSGVATSSLRFDEEQA
jgi:hypothetical protein